MNDIELYPHNAKAYISIMDSFSKGEQKACVVHACGTGKSYQIAAVSSHFDNVLVLAPNKFVLSETKKVCREGVEFKTYSSLLYEKNIKGGYDLIVLDEFHRSGAKTWGNAVKKLLETNPDAKILGASATNVRYLDNRRDMAEEMFGGNVVSRLTISDAIEDGIIPCPTYVTSLYTTIDVVNKYKIKIRQSLETDKIKEERCKYLERITSTWDSSHGVPGIINKYFGNDIKRVIIFFSGVKILRKMKNTVKEWFHEAGYKKVSFYYIDYKERNCSKAFAEFSEPCEENHIKVAVAINMLNEGVHVPDVDGIIMLRTTISRVIFEQQVGRCLTASNASKKPVILDLVNNVDNIAHTWMFGSSVQDGRGKYKPREYDTYPFEVIDESRDLREALNEMDEMWAHKWTKEEAAEEAKKYKWRNEFKTKSPAAYSWARYHNCIDEICEHMEHRISWTKEKVFEVARGCTDTNDFRNNHYLAYMASQRMKIYPEIKAILGNIRKTWTKEKVISAAKTCDSFHDFQYKYQGAYCYMLKHGFRDELREACGFINEKGKWTTVDKVLCEAKKYTSMKDFRRFSEGAYSAAVHRKFLPKIHEYFNSLKAV